MNIMKNLLLLTFLLILNILFSCQKPADPLENMVYIPEGEFRMGSIDVDADGDEQPIHTVYVDAFYMDKYEVTVGEYKRFIKKTGHDAPDWEEIAKYSPTDNHPIVNVNWYDANAYATWMGKRLPTEAEWEKAARGGLDRKKYPWGNTESTIQHANLDGNEDGYRYTAPVGSFTSNGYGLYDMSGNVQEWCLDAYQVTYYDKSPSKNPMAGEVYMTDGNLSTNIMISRVLRGGSFLNLSHRSGRVADRSGSDLSLIGTNVIGFRCVKPVSEDVKDIVFDPVNLVEAKPAIDTDIPHDAIITISYDAPPGKVKVDNGNIITSYNNTITIAGPFRKENLTLKLEWNSGSHVLNYNVNLPDSLDEERKLLTDNMVLIQAGSFMMGSNDPEAENNEQPIHSVYVDDFYIDKYEVTIGEYRKFIRESGYYPLNWDKIFTYSPSDKHPVIGVNWYDAMAYAEWIGKRLPTEAEWEKAARSGLVDNKYTWGNTHTDGKHCNLSGILDGYELTAPVGSYPPNDYGIFDMAGNVWEWCLDEYRDNAYTDDKEKNPLMGETMSILLSEPIDIKTDRVLRGGSWFSSLEDVRVTTRYSAKPTFKGSFVGFRCVMDVKK